MPQQVYTHEEYGAWESNWRRARDVIAGEDAVKAAGIRYLPKLESMSEVDYESYKGRAKFMNATGRTLDGLQGMVFRKDPETRLPEERQKLHDEMSSVSEDVNLKGSGLTAYSKQSLREVISVSRAGTLVDYDDGEKRPYFAFYKAEDIWNWRVERVGGKSVLSMVALHEFIEVKDPEEAAKPEPGEIRALQQSTEERLLVCKLGSPMAAPGDQPRAVIEYQIEIWVMERDPGDSSKKNWVLRETKVPKRRGDSLTFIPFQFHSPDGSHPCCCKLPLEDLISVNLHHYRLSADYGHGLHFTALPTPWIAGFNPKGTFRIGSSVAWVTDKENAKAGFLEYTGQGLNAIKAAIDDDKHDMTVLGAKLLETQKREAETADALRLKQSGESSVLRDIALSVGASLTAALKTAYWWLSTEAAPEDVPDESASVELNTDYIESALSPAELNALVAAWISQAISRATLFHNLRRGEIIPAKRTDEEESALIEAEGPPLIPAASRNGGPGQGGAE